MPRFAANLSMMFTEVAFPARFEQAAQAGFTAVEFLFPYDHPADEVAGWAAAAGVEIILFNLPPGDFAAGERGLAGLPEREAEFRQSFESALHYARVLGTPRLHCMGGLTSAGARLDTYIANLRFAASLCREAEVDLLIEPINGRDMPGYLLDSHVLALKVLDAVAAPNLKLQCDLYHLQIIAGDLSRTVERDLPRIGHIQIAGVPERHEPDTGEVAYPALFALLDRLGYSGWIGCEYRPRGRTEAGLGWLAQWRKANRSMPS